jgi:hypothetical protein
MEATGGCLLDPPEMRRWKLIARTVDDAGSRSGIGRFLDIKMKEMPAMVFFDGRLRGAGYWSV